MKKCFILLAALMISFSTDAFSQFKFGGNFVPADTNIAKYFTTFSGNHGLAVDPDGNLWVQRYSASPYDSMEIGGVKKNVLALHVFDKEFKEVSFSPIVFLDYQGDVDTLGYGQAKTGRGLETAHDGNIIASYMSTVYKINYKTGACMNRMLPFGTGVSVNLSSPAKDGKMVVAKVGSSPVKIFDKDFKYQDDAIDTAYGFARSFEFSPDGTSIYWTSYSEGSFVKYTNLDPDFGDYKDKVDSLFPLKSTSTQSSDWDPKTGYLWFCAGPSADVILADSTKRHMYYAYDPVTGAIKDSIMYQGLDQTMTNAKKQHYAMAFSWEGDTLWVSGYEATGKNPTIQYFVRDTTAIGVAEEPNAPVVNGYSLSQNYPNPFNPSTVIKFHVAKEGLVSLKVYNTLGQEIAELVNEHMNAGDQIVNFNASHLSSGTYIYRLNVNGVSLTNKMVLIK